MFQLKACSVNSIISILALIGITSLEVALAELPDHEKFQYPKPFGTMGKKEKPFEGGKETELFSHQGKGCLTHMWFGGNYPRYGETRILVYVDGETNASIDMELDLGHGIGFQDDAAPWGVSSMGKTGQPSGIYNTYRIPFSRSVRVTTKWTNRGKEKSNPDFWWIIRGAENVPITLGGVQLPEEARLRLVKRENFTAHRLEEFDIYNSKKSGAIYQVALEAKSVNFNFLEGCVRAYIDGKPEPLWLSSGLEDYFLGTYYFNRGPYHNPIAGLTHKKKEDSTISAYRFHDDDPLFFENGLRLTLRCGEEINGESFGKFYDTTYTTYVWVYEW